MTKPINPDLFKVKSVSAKAERGSPWLAVSQDTALPARFMVRADLELPRCSVVIAAEVGPTCEVLAKRVTVEAAPSKAGKLTTTTMRSILVHELVELARDQIERPIGELGEGVVHALFDAKLLKPRQPRRSTIEKIEESARLFREAVAAGSRRPGRHVADRLGVSPSQASRYLKGARVSGLLDAGGQPDLGARIAARRADPEFTARLDATVQRNRATLERLGDGEVRP